MGRPKRISRWPAVVLTIMVVVAGAVLTVFEASPSSASERADASHIAAPVHLQGARPGAGRQAAPVSAVVALAQPAPPGWEVSAEHLMSGGRARSYLLARPSVTPTGQVPLVVVLHGRTMSPSSMERISGFLSLIGPAVVVYPAGYGLSWNAGYCCGAAHAAGVDDVSFIESVIHQTLASHPDIARSRVYLVGYSNGGRMAYRLACADPSQFAGVAAVEAVSVSDCTRATRVPLLEVASTGDPVITIPALAPPKRIAGHTETTVGALLQHWRQLEGCSMSTGVAHYGALTTTEWSPCAGRGRVEFAEYSGGGHSWPRGGPGTPSAQKVIWAFFQGVQGAAPSPTASATPSGPGRAVRSQA